MSKVDELKAAMYEAAYRWAEASRLRDRFDSDLNIKRERQAEYKYDDARAAYRQALKEAKPQKAMCIAERAASVVKNPELRSVAKDVILRHLTKKPTKKPKKKP